MDISSELQLELQNLHGALAEHAKGLSVLHAECSLPRLHEETLRQAVENAAELRAMLGRLLGHDAMPACPLCLQRYAPGQGHADCYAVTLARIEALTADRDRLAALVDEQGARK